MLALATRVLLVCVVAAAAASGPTACGDTDNTEGRDPPLHPTVREEVKLAPCDVPLGGYEVRVSGMSCDAAANVLDRLGRGGPLPATRESVAFDRGNGWNCWADLLKRFGPIQSLCWNGARLIVYKIA